MNLSEINPNTLADCSTAFIIPSRSFINFYVSEYLTFSFVDLAILYVNPNGSITTVVLTKEIPDVLMKTKHIMCPLWPC